MLQCWYMYRVYIYGSVLNVFCFSSLIFNSHSYCDVFQKCREVDPSGPLATLRKLLLSEESIATFKKWVQHNWYTVVLAALGVFVLLVSWRDFIEDLVCDIIMV